jgi:hypothetical protein
MKTKLTIALAVLMLVAVGALNEFATNRTSAQEARPSQGKPEVNPAPNQLLKLSGPSAHCFCRVTANGTEVAKPSKGGYVQPFQAEACRNYCRGIWDAPVSPSPSITWASLLPNACGNVTVRMEAKLGTMSYQTVRGPVTHTGINGTQFVTTCSCPSGQTASNTIGGKKYCLIPPSLAYVPSVPDQVNGTYVWSGGNFYLSSGAQKCVTVCQ